MMIKLDDYIRQLENTDEDAEIVQDREYQKNLFEQYVTKGKDHKELRKKLLKEYQNGASLTGEKGLRKRLGAIDLAYFGRAYLPHYFIRESPEFHNELDSIWSKGVLKGMNPYISSKKISREKGCRRGIAAPRGHAKSTNFTFKDTLHAVVYEYKHYPIILSDSSDQAEGFLADIKTELEDNKAIHEDFGRLKGKKVWKTSVILTSTDVKIEAIGSGKKIRGRRHRNWRPDLIVLDDVENDENVNTPEQRKKLENWFYKAVSKAGDTYTDIVYIGTILHADSLLSKVLKNPEYHCVKYRGVISSSDNQSLWDSWEAIYTNLDNPARQEDAKEFFEDNKKEMLEGTSVLWEAKLSYYDLMIVRISEGEASFNSEIQNDPIDPDSCTFNEEWFDFYDDTDVDFSLPEFIFIGACDPSLGKNKKSDTSAIIALAKNLKTGYMFVAEASVEKRKPDVIIEDAIEMEKRLRRDYGKGFFKFGVESVQFQYFFKDVLADRSREAGVMLPIEEIYNLLNKHIRIESTQPFVKNKYVKFSKKHKTLLKQMLEYPMGKNDDAPDTFEMALRLALQIKGSTKVNYKSIISRALKFRKGAY
jgi:predicted phage terminase large subunit-like protein